MRVVPRTALRSAPRRPSSPRPAALDNAECEYEIALAEVELPRGDIELPLPLWIGREVTGNPDYKKINLQKARLAARAAGS